MKKDAATNIGNIEEVQKAAGSNKSENKGALAAAKLDIPDKLSTGFEEWKMRKKSAHEAMPEVELPFKFNNAYNKK